jgi:predicted PurR-regulated permease PerM
MPVDRRERTREVLLETAETLRHWLLGTSFTMLVLGVVVMNFLLIHLILMIILFGQFQQELQAIIKSKWK